MPRPRRHGEPTPLRDGVADRSAGTDPTAFADFCARLISRMLARPDVGLAAVRQEYGRVTAKHAGRGESRLAWSEASSATPQWCHGTAAGALASLAAASDRPWRPGSQLFTRRPAGWALTAADEADRWCVGTATSATVGVVVVLARLTPAAQRDATLPLLLADAAADGAALLELEHDRQLRAGQQDFLVAENRALARLNRLQGEFVAVASHELKTPLTSIGAYTEILQQKVADPEFNQAEEFLGIVRGEAERLLRMVNRILDYSLHGLGQSQLRRRLVDIAPLVRDTLRTLAPQFEAAGLRLELDLPPDLPRVEIDPDLIRQVIINLVGNAVKFTPAGASVSVRAREGAASVRVDVTDAGPGIPGDQLRKIFRQFYRLDGPEHRAEGSGLGLAIVKDILSLHGGHIDVRSRPGNGSTFSFQLPKEHHDCSAPVAGLGEQGGTEACRRILGLCVRMVAELMQVRSAAVLLLSADEQEWRVHSALGLAPGCVEAYRAGRDEGVAGEVLRTGRSGLWDTAAVDSPLAAGTRGCSPGRLLAVTPVLAGHGIRGVVMVADKLDRSALDADDLNLLTTLGEGVAEALTTYGEHADDRDQVNKICEALDALVRLNRSAVPTVNPLALRLLDRTAKRLGLSAAEARRLQYIASLKDAGMVRLDQEIIHKQGHLRPDERDEVDLHVERGLELIAPLLPSSEMAEIILSHHERVDGSGYPAGRRGQEIPLEARLLAVVDAFFAMIQRRPFRDGMPATAVIQEMKAQAGSQFDSRVVEEFLAVLGDEGVLRAGPPSESRTGRSDPTDGEKEPTWQPQES